MMDGFCGNDEKDPCQQNDGGEGEDRSVATNILEHARIALSGCFV